MKVKKKKWDFGDVLGWGFKVNLPAVSWKFSNKKSKKRDLCSTWNIFSTDLTGTMAISTGDFSSES